MHQLRVPLMVGLEGLNRRRGHRILEDLVPLTEDGKKNRARLDSSDHRG